MLRWLADEILKTFNFVPELVLDKGDPHFDVLRWWLLFVVVLVLVILGVFVLRVLREEPSPPSGNGPAT